MALTVIQNLPSLSLAGNAMRIAISSDNVIDSATGKRRPFYNIFIQIYKNGILLFEDSIEPDSNGVATFNIAPLVDAAIKTTLPYPFTGEVFDDYITHDPHLTGWVEQDTAAVAKLSFKIAEGFGIPFIKGAFQDVAGTFLAISGGCADWYIKQLDEANSDFGTQLMSSNQFLSNQPQTRHIGSEAFVLLRAMLGINEGGIIVSLKTTKTTIDGTTETVTLWTGTLFGQNIYDFRVSPNRIGDAVSYSIWLENAQNQAITPVITFIVSQNNTLQQRNILLRNSLGGWDTVCATGKFISEIELQRTTFNNPVISRFRDTLEPGADRALGVRFLKGSLGFFTDEELEWLQELALSEEVYLITERGVERLVLKTDKQTVADDDLGPKTINIEAICGVSDFFFHDWSVTFSLCSTSF